MTHLKAQLLVLCCLLFCSSPPRVAAHSFLLSPKGDFKSFNKGECRLGGPPHAPNDNCPGPCIAPDSWQLDRRQQPSVYARAQNVSMVWAKNNHRGGFVRFSLVPRNQRMNRTAHAVMAFRYACYVSDKHRCAGRPCGSDRNASAYRTMVQIPTTYPDGEYVLGWTWYGGTVQSNSIFGDYYSCSPVRIRGGPFTTSFSPRFIPGERLGGASRCLAATNRLGDCRREPCLGKKERQMVPFEFAKNRHPAPILSEWFNESSISPTPMPSMSPSPSPGQGAARRRPVRVTGMVMINAETGAPITASFRTVHIRKDEPITFVALTKGPVASVSFYLNDRWIRTERYVPYSFWGDINGDYNAWPNPIFDRWISIRAEASGDNGTKHYKVFWMYLRRRRNL